MENKKIVFWWFCHIFLFLLLDLVKMPPPVVTPPGYIPIVTPTVSPTASPMAVDVFVNPYSDRLGVGSVAGGPGIGTAEVPFFNIDDPTWGLVGAAIPAGQAAPTSFWESSELSMGQLPKHDGPPDTCAETCADQARVRAQKCAVLRKRVALALKEAGCPSKVSPHMKAKRTCKGV